MAEISTIARPYAEALFEAVQDSKEADLAGKISEALQTLAQVSTDGTVMELLGDPRVTKDQIFDVVNGMLGENTPAQVREFLKLVLENNKMGAVSEIADQFRRLVNQSKGEAEVVIESAFPLDDAQLQDLLAALGRKFQGLKLLPTVVIDPSLVGGVKVTVGDQVLDGTVRSRLAEMQSALTS